MKKLLLVIILTLPFLSNVNADINKDVADLKNEFKQIKELYENKIEALEAKIEALEADKSINKEYVSEKSESQNKYEDHAKHEDKGSIDVRFVFLLYFFDLIPKVPNDATDFLFKLNI